MRNLSRGLKRTISNLQGYQFGYKNGRSEGWRMGACHGVREHRDRLAAPQSRRASRILYVAQGFESIDQGVIAALQDIAGELRVSSAEQMQEQAADWKPDAVLVMNGLHVFPDNHLQQIDQIREMGIMTMIWFVDDPYFSDLTVKIASHYDYVFTHERTCVELYQSLGCSQVYHLPLAAHQAIFSPYSVAPEYRTDICFIGMGFWNRVQLFDQLAPYLKNRKVLIGGKLWERMEQYSTVAKFVHDAWITPSETAQYYNGAKIVINLHRTTEAGKDNRNGMNKEAESINPRTFEIAACSTLQLTDLRSELPEQYSLGSEIVVYHDASHLIKLIDYYLSHEEERLRLAVKGYQRTVMEHTFHHRINRLMDTAGLQ